MLCSTGMPGHFKMADVLKVSTAFEQDDSERVSSRQQRRLIILLHGYRVNGYFEVTFSTYWSGEFAHQFRMTRETIKRH